MKKLIAVVTGVIVLLCVSCVSLQDKEMNANERAQAQVLGQVSVEFNSWQFMHIIGEKKIKNIKEKAYQELLRQAQMQYEGNIDVRNITITGKGNGWNALPYTAGALLTLYSIFPSGGLLIIGAPVLFATYGLYGNVQKITATGDVILLGGGTETPRTSRSMEEALNKAAAALIESMPANTTLAILNVYSADRDTSEYIIDALEYRFFNARKFNIVDRRRLEQIRQEQNFQMSGEVSDSSAISIGQMLGAGVVITGSVSGSIDSRRLTLRALDVQTARIITMAMELF